MEPRRHKKATINDQPYDTAEAMILAYYKYSVFDDEGISFLMRTPDGRFFVFDQNAYAPKLDRLEALSRVEAESRFNNYIRLVTKKEAFTIARKKERRL